MRPVMFVLCSMLLFASPSRAFVRGIENYTVELVQKTPSIIVGEVRSEDIKCDSNGCWQSQQMIVAVDRVLKGTWQNKAAQIQVIDQLKNGSEFAKGDHRIFFLKPAGNGTFAVVDSSWYHSLPAARSNVPVGTNALTDVAIESVEVLCTPETVLNKSPLVRNGGSRSSDEPELDPADMASEAACLALKQTPAQVTRPLLTAATSRKLESRSRLWIANNLLATGDWDYLKTVLPLLANPTKGEDHAARLLGQQCYSTIASDSNEALLGNLNADYTAKVLPLFTEMLTSTNTAIRHYAASCLVATRAKGAIRPLARLGINDNDSEVRWESMRGLAELTGINDYWPTLTPDPKNHNHNICPTAAKCLKFWKDWARKHVAAK